MHAIGRHSRAIGLYSKYTTSRHVRAGSEAELIAQINRIGIETGCRFLMTVSETDLMLMYRVQHQLNSVKAILPDKQALTTVLDKERTLNLAQQLGINTPISWAVKDWQQLHERQADIEFPLVLKWSNPHRVAARVSSHGQTLDKYKYIYDWPSLEAYLAPFAELGEFPIIQKYCRGYGLGQMIFMHGGEARLKFQHRRTAEWPPEGGSSAVCRSLPSTDNPEQMEQSITLLKRLNWSGPAMVEYRFDPQVQQATLMEINGRLWGSQPLAYHSGAHFVWLWFQAGSGMDLDTINEYRSGIECRFMIPEVKRLMRILFQSGAIQDRDFKPRKLEELLKFLFAFVKPTTRYYVFLIRDPKPFFADIWQIVLKLLRV